MPQNLFKIYDGRNYFWQWDTNQKLIVLDETVDEVHFSNKDMTHSITKDVLTDKDGKRICYIPDSLLSLPKNIVASAIVTDDNANKTLRSVKFAVKQRPIPSDYIVSEEVQFKDFTERLQIIEEVIEDVRVDIKNNYDAKGSAEQALTDAKLYMEDNYEPIGSAESVRNQLKEEVDRAQYEEAAITRGLQQANENIESIKKDVATNKGNIDDLKDKSHSHENVFVLNGITADKVASWDDAENNAKTHANKLNDAINVRVVDLEAKFTGDGSVESQIASALTTEVSARDKADKELKVLIESNRDDIFMLQGLVGDTKVSTVIENAINVEKDRAISVEKSIETRLSAVETSYATENKYVAQDTAPKDTSILWVDTSDNSGDFEQTLIDTTLSVNGQAADAKSVGDAIGQIYNKINNLKIVHIGNTAPTDVSDGMIWIDTGEE